MCISKNLRLERGVPEGTRSYNLPPSQCQGALTSDFLCTVYQLREPRELKNYIPRAVNGSNSSRLSLSLIVIPKGCLIVCTAHQSGHSALLELEPLEPTKSNFFHALWGESSAAQSLQWCSHRFILTAIKSTSQTTTERKAFLPSEPEA